MVSRELCIRKKSSKDSYYINEKKFQLNVKIDAITWSYFISLWDMPEIIRAKGFIKKDIPMFSINVNRISIIEKARKIGSTLKERVKIL